MRKLVKGTGFTAPQGRPLNRYTRMVELAAAAGLVLSTVVALTAITVGAAHAGVVDGVVGNEGSVFTVALLLGLLFIAIGGLSLMPSSRTRRHRH